MSDAKQPNVTDATVGDLPRKCFPHLYTGLEKQVHDAWVAVEFEGAHPQLTNASSFLRRALEALLDWTDSGRPGAYEDDEND